MLKNFWKEERDAKLIEMSQTHKIDDIAEEFGLTRNAIVTRRNKLRKQGYDIPKMRRPRSWTEERTNLLIEMSPEYTCEEIAERLNVTPRAVERKQQNLMSEGLLDERKSSSTKHWAEEQYVELIKMAEAGITPEEIAEKMDRSPLTVRQYMFQMGFKIRNGHAASIKHLDLTDKQVKILDEGLVKNLPVKNIANQIGVHFLTLLAYLHSEKLPVIDSTKKSSRKKKNSVEPQIGISA